MKKIIVIGVTGSGKSTLAKKLSHKLNYDYISLDQLFWKANWGESTDEELFKKVELSTQNKSWVVDGNYTRTNFITWPKADTVIWIDLPFYKTFYQSFARSLKRAITKEEFWPNTGNRESFVRMFSKDSILLWLLKTYKPNKMRNIERMKSTEYSHIKFYRLQSRKEVENFYNSL